MDGRDLARGPGERCRPGGRPTTRVPLHADQAGPDSDLDRKRRRRLHGDGGPDVIGCASWRRQPPRRAPDEQWFSVAVRTPRRNLARVGPSASELAGCRALSDGDLSGSRVGRICFAFHCRCVSRFVLLPLVRPDYDDTRSARRRDLRKRVQQRQGSLRDGRRCPQRICGTLRRILWLREHASARRRVDLSAPPRRRRSRSVRPRRRGAIRGASA